MTRASWVKFLTGYHGYFSEIDIMNYEPIFKTPFSLNILIFIICYETQECIPVGCVLSAAVAICHGGCLPGGMSARVVVSALGGGVSAFLYFHHSNPIRMNESYITRILFVYQTPPL